jgi:hypothetical protein
VEQPVSKGPLAARWLRAQLPEFRAGAVARARVSVENAGTATWRDGVNLAYHWLDHLGNPIVWDGIRTPLPREVPPGGTLELEARVRAPLPPGRYRLALDLVDEGRLWFAELGNPALESDHEIAPRIERRLAARGGDPQALAAQEEPLVREEEAEAVAHLAAGVAPPSDWSRRVLDAHQEGYAVVAGSIDPERRALRRAPRDLEPYAPGQGRVPRFPHPLLCPSVVRGVQPEWMDGGAGLPAVRAPAEEPWVYDGRIVVRYRSPARRG